MNYSHKNFSEKSLILYCDQQVGNHKFLKIFLNFVVDNFTLNVLKRNNFNYADE